MCGGCLTSNILSQLYVGCVLMTGMPDLYSYASQRTEFPSRANKGAIQKVRDTAGVTVCKKALPATGGQSHVPPFTIVGGRLR
jgi:hypothetical protein